MQSRLVIIQSPAGQLFFLPDLRFNRLSKPQSKRKARK